MAQSGIRQHTKVQLNCGDPFPPNISYYDNSHADAIEHITDEGCVSSMFPERFVLKLKEQHPIFVQGTKEILRSFGGGLAVFGRALVATLNLPNYCGTPSHLICDTIILPKEHCAILLSFCTKYNEHIRRYNCELAKNAKRQIRRFTKEKFSFQFCVIEKERDHCQMESSFKILLEKKCEEQLQWCPFEQTVMTEEKYHNICNALSVCIARTGIPVIEEDESSLCESFHLLTKNHLVAVTNNIDTFGKTHHHIRLDEDALWILELAERLNRRAPTLLVSDTMTQTTRGNRLPNVQMTTAKDIISKRFDLRKYRSIIVVLTTTSESETTSEFETLKECPPGEHTDNGDTDLWIMYDEGNLPGPRVNIALIGWQNTGKSSLGNAIINECVFQSSLIKEPSDIDIKSVSRWGRYITVADTPSLSLRDNDTTSTVVSYLDDNQKSLDAILLIVRASQLKQEHEMMLHLMLETFNETLFKKIVVVFTYVVQKPNPDDFLDNMPGDLDAFLRMCSNRFMFFNIKTDPNTESPDQQFNSFLQEIDKVDKDQLRSFSPQQLIFQRFQDARCVLSSVRKDFWFLQYRHG